MATDQAACFDAVDLGFAAHYEVPKDVYIKLQALAGLMKSSPGAEEFATALISLLARVECVLPE